MDMEPMEAKHMMQGAGTFDRLVGEGTRRRNLVLLQLKVASCWLAVFIYIPRTLDLSASIDTSSKPRLRCVTASGPWDAIRR